jgi:hypothetical protein
MKEFYTAWQLCGDWFWVNRYYAVIKDGRAKYEIATASLTEQSVKLERLERLRQITRYVDPDTKMILIPIE